jgi:hypothetical protein
LQDYSRCCAFDGVCVQRRRAGYRQQIRQSDGRREGLKLRLIFIETNHVDVVLMLRIEPVTEKA